MRIISRKKLRDAARRHHTIESALETWYRVAKGADWQSIQDVRRTYAHADAVGRFTVFNIKGNKYRLVVKIEYRFGIVFIKHVLTHAEYDKGDWKQ